MSGTDHARLWAGPTLVLDAASAIVHAGILRDGAWATLVTRPGEALETIFEAVEQALAESGLALDRLRSIALGVGPGSILGLRLSVMALRTWQQLPLAQDWETFEFRGLELHGRILAAEAPAPRTCHLLTGFRRGVWHRLPIRDGVVGELDLLEDADVESLCGEILYIPTGRILQPPPHSFTETPFSLAGLPLLAPGAWATPAPLPELYLPAPPSFARWTAERHR